MQPAVRASIVTYRTNPGELRHCLGLLELAHCVGRVDIIDNSKCEEIRDIASEYSKATYTPSENLGYGAGHNIAIRRSLQSASPFHLVLNTDIDFQPDELQVLVDYMLANNNIGALQPEITDRNGNSQYAARLLPTPLDLILRRFLPKWLMRKRRERYELRHINRSQPFDVPYIQGSFMLLRCSTLKRHGLSFDERFFMYPEDIDLSRRIHRVSRSVFFPQIKIVHDHRRESYKSWRMTRIHIINMIRYFNKWGWFFDRERRKINRRTLQF